MLHLTSFSFFFLVLGILTSVSLLGVSQVLLIIPALYFAYIAFKNGQLKLPKSTWFLIAFFVMALLSLVFNHSELIRPGKNYGRLKYVAIGILSIYVFRVYLSNATDKVKGFIFNTGLIAIIVVGVVSFYQVFYLGQARAKTLTDTLRYGYGMGMILPVLLGIILRKGMLPFINRKILLASLVLGFTSLYLTYTRGAFLGLICALPFVIYFWNKKKGLVAFGLGAIFVAFLGGFYLFGSGEIGNRFISSRHNSSDSVRFTQWEAAYNAWTEKPILGIGFSDFINQEQEVKARYGIAHQDYKGHAHNILLETLAGTGLLGLLAFMGWLVAWSYEMFKASSVVAGAFIPFIVSLFVSGQFEVVLDANNASLIFMVYALSIALKEHESLTDQPLR